MKKNMISSIPPEIGQLTKLRILDLNVNALSALPKEIGELTSLESLFLFGNDLCALPEEIIKLKHLSTLELDGNPRLVLSSAQQEWIEELKTNGCDVLDPSKGDVQ